MAPHSLKLAAALILMMGIAATGFYINYLRDKVKAQDAEIATLTSKVGELQVVINDISVDRDNLEASLKAAEVQRSTIRDQLNATLRRLRNQKPPTECPRAVEWAVENKEDLAWPR